MSSNVQVSAPLLSILIVNWRSKDFLRQCLRTIEATCMELSPQVVVVDGGSFDGCGEMLAKEFPQVEFVQSPENVGFGRSNNLGFERCSGEFLLLLNPDTELRPGAVQAMVDALRSEPLAGLVGPRFLNSDGTLQTSSVMAFPTPLNQALRSEFLMKRMPRSRLWGSGEAYRNRNPTPVEAVSGAGMLLRSTTFRKLGGFNPAYFMYAEDIDLCLRVKETGLLVYHVPAAEVVHHGGGSSKTQASQFSTLMMREANERFIRSRQGSFAGVRYRALQAVSAGARVVAALPRRYFGSKDRKAAAKFTIDRWTSVLKWSAGMLDPSRATAPSPKQGKTRTPLRAS